MWVERRIFAWHRLVPFGCTAGAPGCSTAARPRALGLGVWRRDVSWVTHLQEPARQSPTGTSAITPATWPPSSRESGVPYDCSWAWASHGDDCRREHIARPWAMLASSVVRPSDRCRATPPDPEELPNEEVPGWTEIEAGVRGVSRGTVQIGNPTCRDMLCSPSSPWVRVVFEYVVASCLLFMLLSVHPPIRFTILFVSWRGLAGLHCTRPPWRSAFPPGAVMSSPQLMDPQALSPCGLLSPPHSTVRERSVERAHGLQAAPVAWCGMFVRARPPNSHARHRTRPATSRCPLTRSNGCRTVEAHVDRDLVVAFHGLWHDSDQNKFVATSFCPDWRDSTTPSSGSASLPHCS